MTMIRPESLMAFRFFYAWIFPWLSLRIQKSGSRVSCCRLSFQRTDHALLRTNADYIAIGVINRNHMSCLIQNIPVAISPFDDHFRCKFIHVFVILNHFYNLDFLFRNLTCESGSNYSPFFFRAPALLPILSGALGRLFSCFLVYMHSLAGGLSQICHTVRRCSVPLFLHGETVLCPPVSLLFFKFGRRIWRFTENSGKLFLP